MTRGIAALAFLCAFVIAAAISVQAAVVTISPGTRITAPGVEPAEWQLSDGWSIVTHKRGVGQIRATGPSYCETPYLPFCAYQLTNNGTSDFPRWSYTLSGGSPILKANMGRGSFYASCDKGYTSPTPSSVWIGTDQLGGRSLAGVKLSQITKMTYYALVSGVPTWLKPGTADANWDSWKGGWYNPRFPIMLTITAEGPAGRRQFWYRPWGDHSTIGDQCSDGRLGIWEQYDCLSKGRWFMPGDYEPDNPVQYENWSSLIAAYGSYTLVATSTSYNPSEGQWKSPGYTDPTDPAHPSGGDLTSPYGRPACTATGKCLNFWVGARFGRLKRPDTFEYKTWYPESYGFRGQMDYFNMAVNFGTSQAPDVVDVTYDFEPSSSDRGPRFVYLSQSALNSRNNADRLINKLGEPDSPYDPVANPYGNNREERLYDVLYKISGKVTARLNAYFDFTDGAGLPLPTRVWTCLETRWLTPTNPTAVGQVWSAWGLLERFRGTGNAPIVEKPFILWTVKAHDRKLY
jgi:hypothetical protein